jgi:hypothetical protein
VGVFENVLEKSCIVLEAEVVDVDVGDDVCGDEVCDVCDDDDDDDDDDEGLGDNKCETSGHVSVNLEEDRAVSRLADWVGVVVVVVVE